MPEYKMTTLAMTREEITVVGMGELHLGKHPCPPLSCLGLGSCIAICAYDPIPKVGGMVHIVLPDSNGKEEDVQAKYANTAIPLLLHQMAKQGGCRSRMIIKLVGGAQMSLAPGINSAFKTGERNLAMTEQALAKENLSIAASDTGGNRGRTVKMYMDTGRVTVKIAGGEEKEL